jgi:MYXO-CTERM domain-containing protein
MIAICTATGGDFSYNATFTAVPGPGAVAALVVLGSTNRRRRRMS